MHVTDSMIMPCTRDAVDFHARPASLALDSVKPASKTPTTVLQQLQTCMYELVKLPSRLDSRRSSLQLVFAGLCPNGSNDISKETHTWVADI